MQYFDCKTLMEETTRKT